jgi:hypothetical protein
MLLPDKHIRFSESLLGLGAFVLDALSTPKTIDTIWKDINIQMEDGRLPARHTFDNLVLAIDILYTIKAVKLDGDDRLKRCVS